MSSVAPHAETPVCNTGGFVGKVDVVRHGVDDLTLVWDYSDAPTRAKILALPFVQTPYGRQLGESGSFGKWEPALGRHYATYSERTNRLSVQLRLAESGSLAAPAALGGLVQDFLVGLAVRGLEPYSPAYVRRVDVAVDVRCEPGVGRQIIDAMGAVRLSGGRRVDVVGDPRSTVYFRPRKGRGVLARTYCRNLKTGKGEPYGLIRFEAQHMFPTMTAEFAQLESGDALRPLWMQRFGGDEVQATVRRIGREGQTVTLADLVESGQIGYAQMERLSAFLDLERLGRARSVYPPSVYASRRREARTLGLAKSDGDTPPLEVELAELLAPARAIWQE